MKKLIILLTFLIVETSFNTGPFNGSFDRFQKLYNEDKEKCFLLAKSRVDNNTTNLAPYYFLLKIELEKLDDLGYLPNLHHNQYVPSLLRMIDYTNNIYGLASKDKYINEQLYEVNCFAILGELNEQLKRGILHLNREGKNEIKDKIEKKCDNFFKIEIISQDKHTTRSNVWEDPRISTSVSNTKVTKFYNGEPTGNEDIPSSDISVELEFLQILNGARVERGLNPLIINQDLCRAARYHSYDMGSQNYTGHATQDRLNNGAKLIEVCGTFTRIWKFGACSRENLAMGMSTALRAYEVWYDSPGHNKNMFAPGNKEIGIGFIKVPGSKYTYYWTTDFN